MKSKINALISIILVLALCAASLASCKKDEKDGTVTVVIGTETPVEYTLDFESEDIENGLFSVLELLEIDYEESGGFLNSVGSLSPTPPEYIYIYTSVEKDKDVSSYAQTLEYKGNMLTSAGVGAGELTIVDDAIIYIGTINYG